jgi:hypothetical protein
LSPAELDLQLKALNIISWKRINTPGVQGPDHFDGCIFGKKYYLRELIDAEDENISSQKNTSN